MMRPRSDVNYSSLTFRRLAFGILLCLTLLFWDLIYEAFRSLILLTRPLQQDTPILAEALRSWGRLSLWIVLFLFSLSIFLFLASFHLLPGLALEQLLHLWKRLWIYLLGRHGAVVFVRNGKILGEVGERSKRGTGLLIVDSQSAVIVEERTRSKETRTKVFTGEIVFLSRAQKIRGSLDLRPQRRSVSNLRAYTQDGVEIITSLSTVFTLGQPPEVLLVTYHQDSSLDPPSPDALRVIQLSEPLPSPFVGQPQYLVSSLSHELDADDREEIHRFVQNFHLEKPERVFSAVQTEGKKGKSSIEAQRIMAAFCGTPASQPSQAIADWTDLPLQIVIDLFREFLASISYATIYAPQRPPAQSLTELKSQFAKRARNQGVLSFQFVQRKDNLPIRPGDEWRVSELIFYPVQRLTVPKFLRSKGIKVLNATFGELRPADESVETQLFDRWLRSYRMKLSTIAKEAEAHLGGEERHNTAFLQMVHRFVEALNPASNSSETALGHLLTLIEAEIENPQTQRWLASETLARFQHLRRKWLENQASPPSERPS